MKKSFITKGLNRICTNTASVQGQGVAKIEPLLIVCVPMI